MKNQKVYRSGSRRSGKKQGSLHRGGPKRQTAAGLRIALIAVLTAAVLAAAAAGIYFWHSFSDPETAGQYSSNGYENYSDFPVYENSYNLVVVNPEQKLPDDFKVDITTVEGIKVDSRIAVYLEAMLEHARADGIDLSIRSGYVSAKAQQKKYKKYLQGLLDSGMIRIKAENQAAMKVGKGNYNDLQTGMSVRFETGEDKDFDQTAAYRWLISNGIQYGFVERFPVGKSNNTMKTPDPVQFRFVGVENAVQMRKLQMCLEEYADYISVQSR